MATFKTRDLQITHDTPTKKMKELPNNSQWVETNSIYELLIHFTFHPQNLLTDPSSVLKVDIFFISISNFFTNKIYQGIKSVREKKIPTCANLALTSIF